MPSRVLTVGSFTALQTFRAIHANALPGGWLGYAETDDVQTGIGTGGADVTDLAVTVTVPASRLVRVSAVTKWAETSGGDAIQQVITEIREGGTTLARLQRSYAGLTGIIRDTHTPWRVLVDLTAGSHAFKVHLTTVGTGAEIETEPAAGYPLQLLVEDLGASS